MVSAARSWASLASWAFCCASLVCSAFISSASRSSVSGIVRLLSVSVSTVLPRRDGRKRGMFPLPACVRINARRPLTCPTMLRVSAAILLPSLAVIGTAACGSEPKAGATATSLAALDAQANRLLGGGTAAFRKQVAALRGHPIVVNQWASWCGPCRFEFPFFQRLAAPNRGRPAVLGGPRQDTNV